MKRLLLLLVVAAAAVTLAGVYLPSDAATVGTATISRQSLDADLTAISQSPDYSCFLAEERAVAGEPRTPMRGAGSTGTTSGIYGTSFTDDWLGSMITDRVAASLVARDGLTPSPAEVATGRSVLARHITAVLDQFAQGSGEETAGCGGTGAGVLSSLPGWFANQLAVAESDQAALAARSDGTGLSAAALASYYASHHAAFDKYCVSAIVVKTKSAAASVQAALAGGATFAQEASAVSITGESAEKGGELGCGVIDGTFLASELSTIPVGSVTPPFSALGVYWLAMVTSRTPQPLSAVRGIVVTTILQAGQSKADAQLTAALKASDVSVDPRYGHAAARRVTLVTPPTAPPSSSLLSVAADEPPVTATAG